MHLLVQSNKKQMQHWKDLWAVVNMFVPKPNMIWQQIKPKISKSYDFLIFLDYCY